MVALTIPASLFPEIKAPHSKVTQYTSHYEKVTTNERHYGNARWFSLISYCFVCVFNALRERGLC